MPEQGIPLVAPQKSKTWLWGVLVVVLVLLGGGVWLAQTELGVFSNLIVVTGVKEAGVMNVDTNALKQFALQVPSPKKAAILKLKFVPSMPRTYDEMFAVSRGAVLGSEGMGAGCGKPQRSLWNLRTEVPIYLTGGKLVGQLGKETAVKQVNAIIKMCVVWAEWSPTRSINDFPTLTSEPYVIKFSVPFVEL